MKDKLQIVILYKNICIRGIKRYLFFVILKTNFQKFVQFLYFLADFNSRGINLKISHKIKQNKKRSKDKMKNGRNVNIKLEYGTANLKEILIELLKQQYINYITMNEK